MKTHSSVVRRARSLAPVLLGLVSPAISTLWSATPPPPWQYVARLGLVDSRHTAADGAQASDAVALAEDGDYVLGTSDLFIGADDVRPDFGRRAQSGWVGGPSGATHRVGLYDATHTRDDGRQETYPLAIRGAGVSVGSSTRFTGHVFSGSSAWVASSTGATIQLGFYDAVHRASDGATVSMPVALNRVGKLIGYSENPETGHRTAWIANTIGQISAIGLNDASHVATDGHHASFPAALNDAGHVIGNSDYFAAGGFIPGSTAWIRRPDRTTRVIGFQSGVHAAPNGQHLGRVEQLTESGYTAGWSARYATTSNDSVGQTAWVTHVDGPNRPVGFYTGIHVGPTGSVHSNVRALNEHGYAIGTSFQYDGVGQSEFDQAGSTAWIATPAGSTVRIGFYDAEHSVNGHQFNDVVAVNGIDALIGSAARYLPNGDYHGIDAFVANAAGYTTRLGLTDAPHTRADGYRASHATAITNDSGYVAGYSERFTASGSDAGKTAWIYTRGARTYVRLVLSVRNADGFAETTITDLDEDGTAVGYFRQFGSDGSDLGERAFVYVPGHGAYVLDANLNTSVASAGWSHFADATASNGRGTLVGTGVRTVGATYGHGVYLVNLGAATR